MVALAQQFWKCRAIREFGIDDRTSRRGWRLIGWHKHPAVTRAGRSELSDLVSDLSRS